MSRHIPTRVVSLTRDEVYLIADAMDYWTEMLSVTYANTPPCAHRYAGKHIRGRSADLKARLLALFPHVQVPAKAA